MVSFFGEFAQMVSFFEASLRMDGNFFEIIQDSGD